MFEDGVAIIVDVEDGLATKVELSKADIQFTCKGSSTVQRSSYNIRPSRMLDFAKVYTEESWPFTGTNSVQIDVLTLNEDLPLLNVERFVRRDQISRGFIFTSTGSLGGSYHFGHVQRFMRFQRLMMSSRARPDTHSWSLLIISVALL